MTRQLDVESREVRLPAMEAGDIHIAPEYLASLLSVVDPDADLTRNAEQTAALSRAPLRERGLKLLSYSAAVDTNALVVTQETAEELGLTTVSDLAGPAPDMVLGAPAECRGAPSASRGSETSTASCSVTSRRSNMEPRRSRS